MTEKKLNKEHFEILLEDIRSDVKLALEGHQTLRNELRNVKEELKDKIEKAERNLGDKIDAVKTALDYHIKLPVH